MTRNDAGAALHLQEEAVSTGEKGLEVYEDGEEPPETDKEIN